MDGFPTFCHGVVCLTDAVGVRLGFTPYPISQLSAVSMVTFSISLWEGNAEPLYVYINEVGRWQNDQLHFGISMTDYLQYLGRYQRC